MNTSYTLRERIRRFFEDIPMKVAWMLPPSVVMWATLRAVAHATTGRYSASNVADLDAMDVVARWSDDRVKPYQESHDSETGEQHG